MVRPADEYSWKEYCRLGQQAPAMTENDNDWEGEWRIPRAEYEHHQKLKRLFTAEKVEALFKEFGIDNLMPLEIKWRMLAKELAIKYHPTFTKGVGRPRHKDGPWYGRLLAQVKFIREKKKLGSDKAALQWLLDNDPEFLQTNDFIPDFESLNTDLAKARKMAKEEGILDLF